MWVWAPGPSNVFGKRLHPKNHCCRPHPTSTHPHAIVPAGNAAGSSWRLSGPATRASSSRAYSRCGAATHTAGLGERARVVLRSLIARAALGVCSRAAAAFPGELHLQAQERGTARTTLNPSPVHPVRLPQHPTHTTPHHATPHHRALQARKDKEAQSTAAWLATSASLQSLAQLHDWLHQAHLCYAVSRQAEFGVPTITDAKILASY